MFVIRFNFRVLCYDGSLAAYLIYEDSLALLLFLWMCGKITDLDDLAVCKKEVSTVLPFAVGIVGIFSYDLKKSS